MKKEVIVSSCDRCNVEVQMDPPHPSGKHFSDPFIIPPGWLHVSGNTDATLVFELDLCQKCKLPALAAAGKGDLK